jgi:hypothetical protein
MGGATLSASARCGGGGGHFGGGPHGGGFAKFGKFGGRITVFWAGATGYRYRGYSYGGSCWRWTPEDRIWVCDGGYGYGCYNYGWRWRHHHHPGKGFGMCGVGRAFGMHGGGGHSGRR